MDLRTVFTSAGLSFACRGILLVGHYVVLNHMHTFAHVQRWTNALAGSNHTCERVGSIWEFAVLIICLLTVILIHLIASQVISKAVNCVEK